MNVRQFFSLRRDEKLIALKKKIHPYICRPLWGGYGNNSYIIKPMLITGKKAFFIGNNVLIRDGARMEAVQKWKNTTYSPKIIIGDGTSIEERFHLGCANSVIIGRDCTLSCDIMISDNEHSYLQVDKSVLDQDLEVAEVSIGDSSFIGAGVKILSGVHIGKHCVIGANSVVVADIPDYSVAVGVPAKVIKTYNSEKKQWIRVGNNKYKESTDNES